jgi:hypothetical protein
VQNKSNAIRKVVPVFKKPTPTTIQTSTTKASPLPEHNVFNLDNIILGDTYQWYIKLQFNYGLFVTVKWVESAQMKWIGRSILISETLSPSSPKKKKKSMVRWESSGRWSKNKYFNIIYINE